MTKDEVIKEITERMTKAACLTLDFDKSNTLILMLQNAEIMQSLIAIKEFLEYSE